MTLCLEPNRSIPGVGNLTAEEEILVTESGFERISPPFPTDLPVHRLTVSGRVHCGVGM